MSPLSPELQRDFEQFWKHMPLSSKDETLIVLKGQLLLEELLFDYCRSCVENPEHLDSVRLNFAQLESLTRSMTRYGVRDWVWGAARQINALRNALAHNLSLADYEDRRERIITLVQQNAFKSDEIFALFSGQHEHTAVAIAMVHMELSIALRTKPPGLLGLLGSGNERQDESDN